MIAGEQPTRLKETKRGRRRAARAWLTWRERRNVPVFFRGAVTGLPRRISACRRDERPPQDVAARCTHARLRCGLSLNHLSARDAGRTRAASPPRAAPLPRHTTSLTRCSVSPVPPPSPARAPASISRPLTRCSSACHRRRLLATAAPRRPRRATTCRRRRPCPGVTAPSRSSAAPCRRLRAPRPAKTTQEEEASRCVFTWCTDAVAVARKAVRR